jgi:hypothetical protein
MTLMPDLVDNLQWGWTSDIDRGSLSMSLDLALGADRAKEHATGFVLGECQAVQVPS